MIIKNIITNNIKKGIIKIFKKINKIKKTKKQKIKKNKIKTLKEILNINIGYIIGIFTFIIIYNS